MESTMRSDVLNDDLSEPSGIGQLFGDDDVQMVSTVESAPATGKQKRRRNNAAGDGRDFVFEKESSQFQPILSPSAMSMQPKFSYPLLYVSPCGTMSVIFRNDVFVEMTVDRTIRVLCPGKFSAASNARGTSSCIMHPSARVYQADTHVYCEFDSDKLAVFGSQGVIFTMKRLPDSYLVSSTAVKGTTPIRSECITYPSLNNDFTMSLLYSQSVCGPETVPQCQDIVRNAKYLVRHDGAITVTINSIFIKQERNGDLSVHSRPRNIRASPGKKTVSVRTHFVDMGVQEDQKAYVKRGVKRIHVSRSGMVVSDGNCITSMDHYGRIVSST